jgi:hypothetical protein
MSLYGPALLSMFSARYGNTKFSDLGGSKNIFANVILICYCCAQKAYFKLIFSNNLLGLLVVYPALQ